MNFLLINSSDSDPFVSFTSGNEVRVSQVTDFPEDKAAANKKPDKLIFCLNRIAEENDLSTVEAISVTVGPGSFTGIRVGVSIAKGLALGLEKKIIPISNFDICLNRLTLIDPGIQYCVLLPAKLPEYYYALVKNRITIQSGCIMPENLAEITEKGTIVVGDFGDESLIKHYYFEYINVKNLKNELDSMLELTEMHADSAKESEEIEPLYIKDFSMKKPSVIDNK